MLYRLFPEDYSTTSDYAWYATVETSLPYEENGDWEWILGPASSMKVAGTHLKRTCGFPSNKTSIIALRPSGRSRLGGEHYFNPTRFDQKGQTRSPLLKRRPNSCHCE